jgi:hypothetical protein
VQHVPAADGEAVNRRDDRLGDGVDRLVDVDDRQHLRLVERGDIRVLAANAEEPLTGAGEDRRAQRRVEPEVL